MRRLPLKTTAAVSGVLLALSLSACGSDSKPDGDDASASKSNGIEKLSVDEIGDKAEAAMKALDTLHMDGDITSDGSKTELDLALSKAGDCAGSVGMDGVSADILVLDGDQYLKGTDEFWQKTAGAQADAVISLLDGRWAKLPSSSQEFTGFCDLDSFLSSLDDDDSSDKTTKGDVEEIDGVKAIKITNVSDEDGTSYAWVATEGEPYLLRLEHEGDEPGTIKFDKFNEKIDATKPADDEIVDLAKMGG